MYNFKCVSVGNFLHFIWASFSLNSSLIENSSPLSFFLGLFLVHLVFFYWGRLACVCIFSSIDEYNVCEGLGLLFFFMNLNFLNWPRVINSVNTNLGL